MKKILSIFLFLGLFLFATTVRAEEVLINSFDDLKALEDVGGEAKLNANITMTNDIRMRQDLVLDLNGYTLNSDIWWTFIVVSNVTIKDTSEAKTGKVTNGSLEGEFVNGTDYQSIQVGSSSTNGKLTIESGTYEGKFPILVAFGDLIINGGTINATTLYAVELAEDTTVTMNDGTVNYSGDYQAFNTHGKITVNGGKINAPNRSAIVVWQDAEAIVNDGELTARDFAVSGNGSAEGTDNSGVRAKITVNGGKLNGSTAIYAPQIDGVTTITGGTITGSDTALEIRAGELNVSGGTFISTATSESVIANGNGTTAVGAAIAVVQHTTKQPIEVTITGGEFEGYHPLVVANPQNNTPEEISQVEVSVSDGTFTSTGDATIVDIEDNTRVTLTGGTYTHEQEIEVADGYTTIPAGDSGYQVVPAHKLTVKYVVENNDGEVDIVDPYEKEYGEGEAYEAPQLEPAQVPEGYHVVRTVGATEGTMGTSDITVTFYYSNIYTLSFVTNGGREIEEMTSTPGEGPAINLANFNDRTSKEHYDLAGWYSDEELTKEYTVWNRDEDVTVYAKWTPTKYTITYNLDGGEAENPVEYTIESDDIKLNNPEKEGHRFVDWKDGEDHSLGMEVTIPKGSTGNKVFNAFYEKEQYKITIGEKELIVDYGTAVDVTGAEYKLEKEGYEFLGYFYEDSPVENIIVRDNIVLTPKFKFIYKMLSSVQTYELNSNKDVVLKANGEIDNLREIMVDNTALLAEQDVTITEGSTIATIHASFLNTLAAGEHTVTFVYNDGEITAPLNVTEYKEAAPKTGDNIMKNVYTLICSTMTFGLSIVLKKKFD